MIDDSELRFLKKALPFFSKLTEQERREIQQYACIRSYTKGETIYNSSNDCLGLIAILSGVVRSYLLSKDGKEVTLYRLWKGDTCILTASCLLKNITFDLYMDVQEDTQLILIDTELYSTLMEKNSYVESYTYQLTNHRFSDVMWMIEQVFFMSLDQRIAVFLIDECAKNKTDTILMTHAEIATCIGSAREAVSRMLNYMQNEHLVELFRGGIRINDRKKLYQLTLK